MSRLTALAMLRYIQRKRPNGLFSEDLWGEFLRRGYSVEDIQTSEYELLDARQLELDDGYLRLAGQVEP